MGLKVVLEGKNYTVCGFSSFFRKAFSDRLTRFVRAAFMIFSMGSTQSLVQAD